MLKIICIFGQFKITLNLIINSMNHLLFGLFPFGIFPILVLAFYLTLIGGIIYFVYKWVTIIISLKQEHNELLKEILKKMDKKD